jgi:hypothetical protein
MHEHMQIVHGAPKEEVIEKELDNDHQFLVGQFALYTIQMHLYIRLIAITIAAVDVEHPTGIEIGMREASFRIAAGQWDDGVSVLL